MALSGANFTNSNILVRSSLSNQGFAVFYCYLVTNQNLNKIMTKSNLPPFTIRQLLEAGVHFGHKTMRRNPKMSKYIYTNRNGLSIIDLNKSAILLQNALKVAKEVAKNNGRILFVATKKQAVDQVADAAKRCGQYYVNFRWLGGMLTNWKTVSKSIKTLRDVEAKLSVEDGEVSYNKKERLVLERQRLKLEQALGGIKDMGGYPDLVFIIDSNKESLAVAEARTLKIPIMAILDSNCNPDNVTFPIPGNDDSAKSIKLYCRLLSDAILSGIKENMAASGVEVKKSEEGKKSDVKVELKKTAKKAEVKTEEKAEEKAEEKVEAKAEEKAPAAKKAAAKPAAKKAAAKPAAKAAAKKPAAKKPAAKKAAAKPAAKKADK